MSTQQFNNNDSIIDADNEILNNDNVKSGDDNTILGNLVNKLVNSFFDSIFGEDGYGKKNFNPKIKEEFKKNFKTNFHGFTEEKIKEVGDKKENIGKAMLAFSAMFDEGGIESYKNELAKKKQSKRLEKVFFSESGALKYYDDYKTSRDDEIIKIINEKINEKKEYINSLFENFGDLKKIGSVDSILKEDEHFEEAINHLNDLPNNEKAKSLKEELTKYKDKNPDSLFLKDAVNDFVKYNKENCKIENDKIVVKEGKEDIKIPSLNNSKYFKIDEIKEYLEKNDPKLKKFIETRNLISSGNNEIINKFLKEYDKIQNSKYAKKIKEYQKNYSEKKKRAKEIDKLDKENKDIIKEIENNEEAIDETTESINETKKEIEESEDIINEKKRKFEGLSLYEKIFGKKAKEIKQAIKSNKFKIKYYQKDIKKAEKKIKEIKKINEDCKKKICESVKEINKNYHTGKVELKYKDLKGKEGSKINYEEKVSEAIDYAKEILENKYNKGKHFKELQEAQEKFQKEHRKNIFGSKKIDKIIIKDEVNTKDNKLNTSIDSLKKIIKKYNNNKNNIIFSNNNKKNENTLNQY